MLGGVPDMTVIPAENDGTELLSKEINRQDLIPGLATNTKNHKPLWPVFISAGIFALLHVAHGPDFIALFILALGLGYIYRQTHRVLPCIIIHFMLNGTSMALLFCKIFSETPVQP